MATVESSRNSRRMRRFVALTVSVLIPLALGALGGVVTAAAIPGWYAELTKPSWNPPPWLFGPVWTTLYISMGIAAWRVWSQSDSDGTPPARRAAVRSALLIYGIQLGFNAIWSPVFFGLKRIDLALVIIVLMLAAIIETGRRFYRLDHPAAWLLLPYLGWVSFATLLSGSIWLLNR